MRAVRSGMREERDERVSQSECVRVCPCVCGGADDSFILDKPLRAQKCNWGIWEMLHWFRSQSSSLYDYLLSTV